MKEHFTTFRLAPALALAVSLGLPAATHGFQSPGDVPGPADNALPVPSAEYYSGGPRYYGPVSAYPLGYYRYPQLYGPEYSRATSGYAMGPYPYALPEPGYAETPVYPFLFPYYGFPFNGYPFYGYPWAPSYGFGFPYGFGFF
jgi:hypothetical protein